MRRIALLLSLILIVSTAEAQLNIGVSGLLGRHNLSGDSPAGSSWSPNFQFGAALQISYELTSDVSLTLQPGYAPRKSALQYTVPQNPNALISKDTLVDSLFVTTSWIDIPIGMRVYSGSHRWFFSTGATLSLLQSIEIDTLTGSYEPDNAIKGTDLSLFIGAGYRIPVDPVGICIEVRYSQGLVDLIGENQDVTFRQAPIIRMGGLQARVSAEWRFDL